VAAKKTLVAICIERERSSPRWVPVTLFKLKRDGFVLDDMERCMHLDGILRYFEEDMSCAR